MSKTINNVFYSSLTFEKMIDAFYRACINKQNKYSVLKYKYKLERNIVDLVESIKLDKYNIGHYKKFIIYEPKERIIKCLPFCDRIVHQWYVYEFLIPYVVPKFIYDSYACLKGKGTHKAVERLDYFMQSARLNYGNYYILKMDIKNFFYNINPEILLNIIKKYFKDVAFINLTKKLIFEKDVELGIPIGNYTSQYFANIYLNELDQYVKHELKIKYYLRYMDDFILLVKNKEEAKEVFSKIKEFLWINLKLELNHKSKYYPPSMGIDFCGYRVYYTHKLVRNGSKKLMIKRIKNWNYLYESGQKLDEYIITQSLNSWKAHIKHANSYNLYKSYLRKIKFDLKVKDEFLKKETVYVQLSLFDNDVF
ncbi:MAG: RNA-directed DNA polymerase [Bacilli bacterium]|nr:RNA-directed DNA polymerase [Bacilli bacterium]